MARPAAKKTALIRMACRTSVAEEIQSKVEEVFRELVLVWTQRAFTENYELVFRTEAGTDAGELATALRERADFVADSVKMTDSRPGRFRFTAIASLGPDEMRTNLIPTAKYN
jgi:hypothetical protein